MKVREMSGNLNLSMEKLTFGRKVRENLFWPTPLKAGRNLIGHCISMFFLHGKDKFIEIYLCYSHEENGGKDGINKCIL